MNERNRFWLKFFIFISMFFLFFDFLCFQSFTFSSCKRFRDGTYYISYASFAIINCSQWCNAVPAFYHIGGDAGRQIAAGESSSCSFVCCFSSEGNCRSVSITQLTDSVSNLADWLTDWLNDTVDNWAFKVTQLNIAGHFLIIV